MTILLQAFWTGAIVDELCYVSLEELLSDFHLDHDDKECGDEGVAHFEHVEVEEGVEHVGKVAVALQFGEDLVSAHLEQLIDIAEEALQIVVEVLARVHKHRVEDEAIKKDKDLEEDGHDEREGKAQIFVEVVEFVVLLLLLPIGELEDGQYLKECAYRGIFLAEEYDGAHQKQKDIPIPESVLQGVFVLELKREDPMFLVFVRQKNCLVGINREQNCSYYLLKNSKSFQFDLLLFLQLVRHVKLCLDHQIAVQLIFGNQLIISHKFILPEAQGKSELIATEQQVPEKVSLEIMKIGHCFLNCIKLSHIELVFICLPLEFYDGIILLCESNDSVFIDSV